MSLILNIETATEVCSVCLSDKSGVITVAESEKPNSHSSVLTVLIQQALTQAGFSVSQLDAVALSAGPGSYTGLRIGASVAKGLCYSLDIPFIAISTLQSMANGAITERNEPEALYCPMLDARRMDVYTALYDGSLKEILPPQTLTLNSESFSKHLEKNKIIFFGSGSMKFQKMLDSPNSFFQDNFRNSAKMLVSLAQESFKRKQFSDFAHFEPFYLQKNFQNLH